jgi:hypothetical protein
MRNEALTGEEYADIHFRFQPNALELSIGHIGAVAIGEMAFDSAPAWPTAAASISIGVWSLCICISGPFPD